MTRCMECEGTVDMEDVDCIHCGRPYCSNCRSPEAHDCPSYTTSEGNLQMAQHETPVQPTVDVPDGSLQRLEILIILFVIALVVGGLLWGLFGPGTF